MLDGVQVLVLALLAAIPLASLVAWFRAWGQLRLGRPLVPFEPRRHVPWGLVDMVLIAVVLSVFCFGLSLLRPRLGIPRDVALDELPPSGQAMFFVAYSVSNLAGIAFCFLLLAWRGRAKAADFGIDISKLRDDIRLGAIAFVMLIVPVFLLQLLLTRWFPTRHPLIELLRKTPNGTFLAIAAFSAVVAAPIFEEAFFRLFLQGWLEKLDVALKRRSMGVATDDELEAVVVGDLAANAEQKNDGDTQISDANPLDASDNPYSPPASHVIPNAPAPSDLSIAGAASRPGWLPIIASATFFSLAHVTNGPDWIPLFFLALGLGYLYQRTHRIQSCLVVHVLVNALAVVQLWLYVRNVAGE